MNTSQPYTRHDVSFASGEDTCAAWLYLPIGVTAPPVVILGHGLGATREMRLDAFAERFAQAGIAALAFTYRHFGDSGGQPRQLLSIKRQLADWDAAIAWVNNRRGVDATRIAVWGSSFGGGHAITVASRHPELKAAVAQCPFTDGLASALALGPAESLKVLPAVAMDFASMLGRRAPTMIPLAGAAGFTRADERPGRPSRVPGAAAARHDLPERGSSAGRPDHHSPTAPGARRRKSNSQSCSASATPTASRHRRKPCATHAPHPGARSNATTPAISTSTSARPSKRWHATRSSF